MLFYPIMLYPQTKLFPCWFGLVVSLFVSASLKVFSQGNLRGSPLKGPQLITTVDTLTLTQYCVLSLILFVN